MSITNFDGVFQALIGSEGGYSNNPNDPGGETMYGITKRVATEVGYSGEMKDLSLDKAKEIAKTWYWDKYRCDELDPRIGFLVFDAAYNGGHPVNWLQYAVGAAEDGVMGAETIALAKQKPLLHVITYFTAAHLKYYTALSGWGSFGKGWANRISYNLMLVGE